MIFIKGTVNEVKCGYSQKAIELLNKNDIPFTSFDILGDEDVCNIYIYIVSL